MGVRQGRGRAAHQHVARIPDGEPGWTSCPLGSGVMAEEAPPPSPPPLPPCPPVLACPSPKTWPSPRRAPPPGTPSRCARPAGSTFSGIFGCPVTPSVAVAGSAMRKVRSFFRRYVAHTEPNCRRNFILDSFFFFSNPRKNHRIAALGDSRHSCRWGVRAPNRTPQLRAVHRNGCGNRARNRAAPRRARLPRGNFRPETRPCRSGRARRAPAPTR